MSKGKDRKEKEAVSGIIFSLDRMQVLLIQRQDVPVWVLPGGGIDPGESPEEAIVREMQEATGYEVAISRKVAHYSPSSRFTETTHFFECAIVGGKASRGAETMQVQFFPINKLPSLFPDVYRDWIQDAQEHKETVLYKTISKTSYFYLIRYLCMHPILVIRFLCLRWKKQRAARHVQNN